jgi:hypothetical protein
MPFEKLMAKPDCPTYAQPRTNLIDIGQPGFRFLPCVAGGHRRLPPGGGLVFGPEPMTLNILTGGFKLSAHVARMFALASIAPASPDRRLMHAQLILEYSQKNKKTRQALGELMEVQFKDPFIRGSVEKGHAEGRRGGWEDVQRGAWKHWQVR